MSSGSTRVHGESGESLDAPTEVAVSVDVETGALPAVPRPALRPMRASSAPAASAAQAERTIVTPPTDETSRDVGAPSEPAVEPVEPVERSSATNVQAAVALETTPGAPAVEPEPAGLGVGDVVAGKYVITEVLGRGGMGQVLAAKHSELGTMVAIKVVLPEALGAEATVARFKREALAMARLRSEHAVRILDVGDANGMPFIMMEYLEGNDLAAELRRRGPLPIREAVRYVLEAIDVLAEAHDMGIVHRDLKPGNLFLAWRPSGARSIRVLDFGIAKPMIGAPMPTEDDLAGRAPGKLTVAGMTLGTPHFMAPEQVSSGAIGPHTDVWGVGATLYTLLTGTFPFTGPTVSLICGAVCSLPPIPPRERRPEIPVALEAIILKCLEKAPNRRFVSIRELAAALGHAVDVAPPPTTMGLRLPPARVRGQEPAADGDAEAAAPSSGPRSSRPGFQKGRRRSDPSIASARESSRASMSGELATSHTAGDGHRWGESAPPPPQTSGRARLVAVAVVVGLVLAGAATADLVVRSATTERLGSKAETSPAARIAAAARAVSSLQRSASPAP